MIEGLQDYRAGRRANADKLMKDIRSRSALPEAPAMATAILSMIRYEEGDHEYARTTLARARELMRPHWPGRARRGPWQEWLIAHLILQEAEKLIGSAEPAATTK